MLIEKNIIYLKEKFMIVYVKKNNLICFEWNKTGSAP
jgi:hypothetical protein